jgi:hypothetical protein
MAFIGSLQGIVAGDSVCVVGRGETARIHRHVRVSRITKTRFVTVRWVGDREVETSFWFSNGREVGGRTLAAVKCQQKES